MKSMLQIIKYHAHYIALLKFYDYTWNKDIYLKLYTLYIYALVK